MEEDDNSQVITVTYQDAKGIPLIGSEGGAKVVFIYAKNLTAAVNARVDNMGLGMLLPSGERGEFLPGEAPVSEKGALYDDDDHYYDQDWKPMLLSTEIYGVKGEKTLGAKRWHREVRSYDERGNLIRTDYLDADGELIISATGSASTVNTYDEQNRVIQIDYLDKEGNLIKMINGYARVTYEYYEGSDKVHYERFFGADGERTMITRGMSMIEYEYGGEEEWDYRETYYDILDNYTMSNAGCVRVESKFTGPGSVISGTWVTKLDNIQWQRIFGTDLKLIKRKAGYAGYENFRNEYGQIIKTVYMDDQWQPTRNEETQYSWVEFEYQGTDPDEPAAGGSLL